MKLFWRWVDKHLIGCIGGIMLISFASLVAMFVIHEVNITPEVRAQQQAMREQTSRDALLAQAEAFGRRGVIAKHPKGFCFFYVGATAETKTIAFSVPCPENETH